jgi:hypothetical protein
MTFRSVAKPSDLFSQFISLFNAELASNATEDDKSYFNENKLPSQFRIIQAVGLWVDSYWNDFAHYSLLKTDLESFLEELAKHSAFQEAATFINSTINSKVG